MKTLIERYEASLANYSGLAGKRIEELERICAEAYQVVGILADECGRFDDDHVIKIMDNLSQQELIHDDVLPFSCKDKQ